MRWLLLMLIGCGEMSGLDLAIDGVNSRSALNEEVYYVNVANRGIHDVDMFSVDLYIDRFLAPDTDVARDMSVIVPDGLRAGSSAVVELRTPFPVEQCADRACQSWLVVTGFDDVQPADNVRPHEFTYASVYDLLKRR
jgi:hypothetical protein